VVSVHAPARRTYPTCRPTKVKVARGAPRVRSV